MKQIGILIETDKNGIKETNAGPITLAKRSGGRLTAFLIRREDQPEFDGGSSSLLGRYGVDTVLDIVLPAAPEISDNPVVRAKAVVAAVQAHDIDTVMGLSGAGGRDLIPRVAALLDAPLVMDCMDADLENKMATTSQYSGKTLAKIQMTGECVVFGIRPNAVKPEENPSTPELVRMDADASVPENFKILPGQGAREEGDSDQVSLSEADIIISGGRGMKSGENFGLLFDCAQKMKAAVGASRVAVDNGWVPYAHQVGQTGEKVSPSVYIACGISGSIQHFAGMKTAGMIIAVNQDDKAAIVANSDYYVIGDLFEIIPELMRHL